MTGRIEDGSKHGSSSEEQKSLISSDGQVTCDHFGHKHRPTLGNVGQRAHRGHEVGGTDVIRPMILQQFIEQHARFFF